MITQTAQVRQQFSNDFHRPTYHFLPPSNWMNDPNGLIQWQGRYHLFYQHNPDLPIWGNMHWGHASSPDLIHWTDLPMALAPTPGGVDEAGVFSGCAVNHNGVPTLIYTGTRGNHCEIQTQCLATGSADLLTWEKYAGNPVLSAMPPITQQDRDFRDPYVWQEGDIWYMVLGSRIVGKGGAVFLYRSTDLLSWEYLHPLLTDTGQNPDGIWECPNFFRLGEYWVLIISGHLGSATGEVGYFVGTYENLHFTPLTQGVLDRGCLYAPLTFLNDQNERILFGWLREWRTNDEMLGAGWSGVQAIPRLLSLDQQQRLLMTPIPALNSLHHDALSLAQKTLTSQVDSIAITGHALDIQADLTLDANGTCALRVLCAPDASEYLEVAYDMAQQQLTVRPVLPNMDDRLIGARRDMPHALHPNEPLQLRILVDGSVIEVIANERTSITSRFYATQPNAQLQYSGSHARLDKLDIWNMSSIW